MRIRLGQEQRDTIFPANIVLNNELRVTALGPVVRRRFPELVPGQSILDHFRLTASASGTTIEELSGSTTLLSLESRGSHQVLNGWVIPYQDGYLLALRLVSALWSGSCFLVLFLPSLVAVLSAPVSCFCAFSCCFLSGPVG